jgi:hypothetical protein
MWSPRMCLEELVVRVCTRLKWSRIGSGDGCLKIT